MVLKELGTAEIVPNRGQLNNQALKRILFVLLYYTMFDKDPRFFTDLVTEIEAQRKLWVELHGLVFELLKASSRIDDDRFWDKYDEESEQVFGKLLTIPLRDSWYISVNAYGNSNLPVPCNRWGEELTRPIEVGLWLSEDAEATHWSGDISDNPKISIVASPIGVVNLQTGEQLSSEEIQAMINDFSLLNEK